MSGAMSAIGTKQTSAGALQMSANDPKRTSVSTQRPVSEGILGNVRCASLSGFDCPGRSDETAGISRPCKQCGRCVAACGVGAGVAADAAGQRAARPYRK
jgi:ferredoxin